MTVEYFNGFQPREAKQTILKLPSAKYISKLEPGEGGAPTEWEQTKEHAEIFMKFLYDDYLVAAG